MMRFLSAASLLLAGLSTVHGSSPKSFNSLGAHEIGNSTIADRDLFNQKRQFTCPGSSPISCGDGTCCTLSNPECFASGCCPTNTEPCDLTDSCYDPSEDFCCSSEYDGGSCAIGTTCCNLECCLDGEECGSDGFCTSSGGGGGGGSSSVEIPTFTNTISSPEAPTASSNEGVFSSRTSTSTTTYTGPRAGGPDEPTSTQGVQPGGDPTTVFVSTPTGSANSLSRGAAHGYAAVAAAAVMLVIAV